MLLLIGLTIRLRKFDLVSLLKCAADCVRACYCRRMPLR
jgi:hypothetical protein